MLSSIRIFDTLTPAKVVTTVFLFYVYLFSKHLARHLFRVPQLPPGPPRKWITGNRHQISRVRTWLTVQQWSKLYGPLVYIRVLRKETVFLNDAKTAVDILDSNAAATSNRPHTWMIEELAGRKHAVFNVQGSDPRFRLYRTLLQDGLNPRAAKSYRQIQLAELRVLLKAILDQPDQFMAHIRRNSIAMIMKIAYGYEVKENDDPFVTIIEDAFNVLRGLAEPGKYWVEFLPFLRFAPSWLPGAGFKCQAKQALPVLGRIEGEPYRWAKEKILHGNFVESFTSKYLVDEHGNFADEETQDALKWTSAALFVGGGDTTVSTLTTFFLVMALYPEVQKRAQEEVDRAIIDRLPTLDDIDSLVYCKALLKEVLRYGPATPMGLSHLATEDVTYNGYLIPKGASVIANIWAITHDEVIYPEPDTFDPSRHLGKNPQPDPTKFVFGFGRRICPGLHLAQMSLFLNIINILALYDIKKPVDAEGKECEPKVEWGSGITMHLQPFKCRIEPRSQDKLTLLSQWESI